MDSQSLIIGFSNPTDSREPVVLIMLEQGGFVPYTGYVTKSAAMAYLGNLIYGTENPVDVNCGMDGINCDLIINAYPYYPELNYQLLCSYGTLSEGVIQEIEKSEVINLELETAVNVKYPVLAIVSAEWLLDAYDDELGMISPPPDILVGEDAKTVSTSIPCYGSVLVTYKTIVHSYILHIEPRLNSDLKPYSSVVFAVYDGGLVWLVTESPAGADESKGDCANGSRFNLNPDDPKQRKPDPECADKVIRINYCTQKKLSEVLLSYAC